MAKKLQKPSPKQEQSTSQAEKLVQTKPAQSSQKAVEESLPAGQNKAKGADKLSKKLNKEEVTKIEEKEKAERVSIFGLYFHNSKTLSTFLFFAVGIIIVPIFTYLKTFDFLVAQPEITKNQAQMYSGFISVGVVILFLIGYCVIAITDESNFQHEQRQYNLLSDSEQKKLNASKLREAFEENAVENGIKEVVNQNSKPSQQTTEKKQIVEQKKQDTKPSEKSKVDTKAEPVKTIIPQKPESTKPSNTKTVVEKQQPKSESSKPKEDKQSETKISNPKKTEKQDVTKAADSTKKVVVTEQADSKKQKKDSKAVTPGIKKPVETVEITKLVAPKIKVEDDDWNVVKQPTSKKDKQITDKESQVEKKEKDSKIVLSPTESSDSDGFTVVRVKKTGTTI